MKERTRLSESAKRLLSAIEEGRPKNEINKEIINFCEHIGNISGFCDKSTNIWTDFVIRYMSVCLLAEGTSFEIKSHELKVLLPRMVGLQVDYTKAPPFKIIGFDVEASLKDLKAKIGAQLKR